MSAAAYVRRAKKQVYKSLVTVYYGLTVETITPRLEVVVVCMPILRFSDGDMGAVNRTYNRWQPTEPPEIGLTFPKPLTRRHVISWHKLSFTAYTTSRKNN